MKNRRFIFGALTLSIFFLCSFWNVYLDIRGPPSLLAYTPQLTQVAASTLTISSGRSVVVTSTSDGGSGSLRQALIDAQSGDTITFDPTIFPPSAPAKIYLKSNLLDLVQGYLTIDASNAGVILDGSKSTEGWTSGIKIKSGGNTIRGLKIINFNGPGIMLFGSAQHNTIGGDRKVGTGPTGQGNLIYNVSNGIYLFDPDTSFNIINGNIIGSDSYYGDNALEPFSGIYIENGGSNNIIGPNNVIAFHGRSGIYIRDNSSSRNKITQNSIHDNGKGITLFLGANKELAAPFISGFDLVAGTVTGTASPNCLVEIFSDSNEEGMIYEGKTIADEKGIFHFSKGSSLVGPHVSSIVTDIYGNSSEFSTVPLGISGFPILQEGNDLPRTEFQPKQSMDLEDNRLGQMASLMNVGMIFVDENCALGFKWIRLSLDWFDWPDVESTGIYSKYYVDPSQDQVVNGLIDNGFKIMYTLVYWDENIKTEGQDYSRYNTEEEIQGYLDYLRFILHHFKGRIEYLEILNEPSVVDRKQQYVEVTDYINLVRRAIPVIREEDPDLKIVVGANNPLETQFDRDYFFKILSSDIMPLVDAVSWHIGDNHSPENAEFYYNYPSLLQEIKSVASSHGFRGEYISEELHWWVHYYEHVTYSEISAAKYYARGILMHLGMGFLTGVGLGPPSTDPLIERTVRNLCTVMAGAKPTSLPMKIQSDTTLIRNCSFTLTNGDKLVAFWTDGIAVAEDSGVKFNLTLSGFDPQYVIGIDPLNSLQQSLITSNENCNLTLQNLIVRDYPLILKLSPIPKTPLITDLTITPTEVKTGQPIEISVKVTNTEDRERNYTLLLTINGFEEDAEIITLGGGKNGTTVFRVTKDSAGSYMVNVGNLTGVFTVIAPRPATILLSPLQITKTTVKPGEEVEVTATLENVGELPGNYTIIFTLDGVEKGSLQITLDGGETTIKTLKISSDVVGVHHVSVGDKSVTLEVVQAGIPGYPYESVLIGLVLVVIILTLRIYKCAARAQ